MSDWTLARHRLRDDAWGVLLIWAGFTAFMFAVILTVSALRSIEVSGWEIGSQLARWFAGGVGVYATAVYLPLYIAHGYTRREAARQLPVASVGTILLLAALMTAGYGIERLVYTAAGWPQTLEQQHLFTSPDQYGLILVEFTLLLAVWAAAGALAGAAFYRGPGPGALFAPVVLVLVGVTEAVLNPGFFELITGFLALLMLQPEALSNTAAAAVALACLAAALPVTWLLVRDLPLRNRPT